MSVFTFKVSTRKSPALSFGNSSTLKKPSIEGAKVPSVFLSSKGLKEKHKPLFKSPEKSQFTLAEDDLWEEDDDIFDEKLTRKDKTNESVTVPVATKESCSGTTFDECSPKSPSCLESNLGVIEDSDEEIIPNSEEDVKQENLEQNDFCFEHFFDEDVTETGEKTEDQLLEDGLSISGCNSFNDTIVPSKELVSPDASVSSQLKPLGVDEDITCWLNDMVQHEAFQQTNNDNSESAKLKLQFLQKSYTEILEKMAFAFESIPLSTLKMFPNFSPQAFQLLRSTKRRIKAITIRTENSLRRMSNYGEEESLTQTQSVSKSKSIISYFGSGSGSNPAKNEESVDRNSPKPKVGLDSTFIDLTGMLYKSPPKESSKTVKMQGNMKNDGVTGEFDGTNFPHSREMLEMFAQKFGLKSFRTNQLQVVNAVMLGHDCFVLMPTGGGKSLCYQLPAVISQGVTVVISPLRSLILDQVTKLQTLDIAAAHLSGDMTESAASGVYSKLNQREPALKLLYVTPEKVGASNSLRSCLAGLYRRGMLARFVIDEVHCVSQWGHDFRPDYKKLRELRENYPNVKIIALTATATPRVRTDILFQLKMSNPKWFLSSFNRSNLTYSVKDKKGKSPLKEIALLIEKQYKRDSGVIYCFSRKECEDVAAELKLLGVDAIAYHAGLTDPDRTRVQNLWMNDKVKVVCATIAFGMGIDKLDVRFVIHYSLPKSIEGYYQESGRAGRDGEKATCILYYAHKDKIRILKLINMDQTLANLAARKVHVDNLFRVVAFAENRTDCRRALQLEYFGEQFNHAECLAMRSTACDNCLQKGQYEKIEVTSESKAIVSAVDSVCGGPRARYTMLHFVDIFKGSTVKKIMMEGHNTLAVYGMGKTWLRVDIERLFRKLINEEFLKEVLLVKEDGITLAYLKSGGRKEELLRGNVKVMFELKKTKAKLETVVATNKITQASPAVLRIQETCYRTLMEVIHGIAGALNCNPNAIMNVQAIRAMSLNLPKTAEDMLAIPHVTKANYDKYGAALLDVTQRYAKEKEDLEPSVVEPPPVEQPDDGWLGRLTNDDSPYFEPEIEFVGGRGARGRGQKRRRPNFKKWQSSKRTKSAGTSNRSSGYSPRGRGKTRGSRGRGVASGSGVTTVAGAKFSTLMELPTTTSRFARPRVFMS